MAGYCAAADAGIGIHQCRHAQPPSGAVRLRVVSSGHACGSTTENVRSMVEEGVYEYAPDVTSLVIAGLEEPPSSGFVTLQSLAGSRIANTSALASHSLAVGGAD